MIQNSSGIFYPLTPANSFIPKELTQPILESIFIHNNYPVILVLTEHHIVAADSKTKKPLQFCPLVFETKFETQQIPSNVNTSLNVDGKRSDHFFSHFRKLKHYGESHFPLPGCSYFAQVD